MNTERYSEAKKMYYEYECSEYNMKTDDKLDDYKKYGVPSDIQNAWKKEYINELIQKLRSDKDMSAFHKLVRFSKDSNNVDLLKILYDHYKSNKKTDDIFYLAEITSGLVDAINLFTVKDNRDLIAIIIEDLSDTIDLISLKIESENMDEKLKNTEYLFGKSMVDRIKTIMVNSKNYLAELNARINRF